MTAKAPTVQELIEWARTTKHPGCDCKACRMRPHVAAALERCAEMEKVLDELEGSFDEQTYAELSREELNPPDDREYSVNVTYKQLRAITAALNKRLSPDRANEGKEL